MDGPSMCTFSFGVEIEVIAEPRELFIPAWTASQYYAQLADCLRDKDLNAVADPLCDGHRKHPEHYDKWFITKDGSLGRPTYPLLAFEIVSPTFDTSNDWDGQIRLLWKATSEVFKKSIKDIRCGSHVHISPIKRHFTLVELKEIAFAIVNYEDYVFSILPLERQDHIFCRRNSQVSLVIKDHFKKGKSSQSINKVRSAIKSTRDTEQLCKLMQGETRHALWNFQNTNQTSGTIEFRGGCCLRSPLRTYHWIAFVVSFISLALEKSLFSAKRVVYSSPNGSLEFKREVESFWETIRSSAGRMGMAEYLPKEFKRMNETRAR